LNLRKAAGFAPTDPGCDPQSSRRAIDRVRAIRFWVVRDFLLKRADEIRRDFAEDAVYVAAAEDIRHQTVASVT
jgi:hypothetical protein